MKMQRQEDRLQQPLLQEVALQRALLTKMMLASVVCCVIGAVGMGLFRHYLLMGIFLAAIAVIYVCALLAKRRVLPAETAALMPMLVFCFVYTPASWYTFGGLLGSTPYLAIIFAAMIALTNYRHGGYLVLGAYLLMLAGLTADWFSRYSGSPSLEFALSTLTAFALALSLIIVFLEKTKQKNSEISRSLLDSSICDDLTKLYNRRAVELIFGMVEERYQNKEMDYTVLMLDIDRFKHANDQYGHAEGDAALQAVAACIQGAIRTTDYAVRYGGDEFLIVLPLATQEGVRLIRERIETSLREVKALPFPVSVSTGSARRSECEHRDALIALADARMYEAKRTLQETEHRDDTEAIGPKTGLNDQACGE
jgi:diguanylate cyclase (GGDEF)-like protein